MSRFKQIVGNVGRGIVAFLDVLGDLTVGGDLTVTGDIVTSSITTDSTDLVIQPDAGQVTKVGSGSSIYAVGNNDLLVSGVTHILGVLRAESTFNVATVSLINAGDMKWSADDGWMFALTGSGAANNNVILTLYGNRAKDHDHTPASVDPTLFIHSSTDPDTDNTEFAGSRHNKVDAVDLIGKGSIVTNHLAPVELADQASFSLPDASAGFGTIMAGDGEEYTTFHWTSAGVVTLGGDATANVVATDTDTNLCIFDGGTAVTVRNRLGSAKKIMFTYNYTTP